MKNFFKKLFCSDSWSKNFSETVRRVGKNNAGFSLVELIVVIAIMAILAAVAVVGVSVYIPKAQQAADKQLFSDIEQAFELAYLADPNFKGGYVVIPVENKGTASASNSQIEQAMVDTFGPNWKQELSVKCDDWVSSAYKDSSFATKEDELIDKVDSLTNQLADIIAQSPDVVGTNFNNYLGKLEIENKEGNEDKVADAAVLYVAESTAKLNQTQKDNAVNTLLSVINYPEASAAVTPLTEAFGSTVAGAAALYALAQSYCMYENGKGNAKPLEILNDHTFDPNADNAIIAVMESFHEIQSEVIDMENGGKDKGDYSASQYFQGGQARTDAYAYLNTMESIYQRTDEIIENSDKQLGDEGFFKSDAVVNVVTSVTSGAVTINARIENGELVVEFPKG